jgi:uncharacterized membrane protein
MIFGREPAAIAAVVAIAINLLVSFGLKLTVEQIALVNALVVGVLALLVRQVVTPVAAPQLPSGTEVNKDAPGPTTVVQ